MRRAIRVAVDDGQTIFLEVEGADVLVEEAPAAGEGVEGFAGGGGAALVDKLDQIGGTILAVCRSVHEKAYRALKEAQPTEFELEFGVTLAGEAGIPLVTKGSVEAQIKVTARWETSAS